jgi:Ca2+-binding RTX toxin-like protein
MKVKKNGFNLDTLTDIEAIGGTFFIDRMSGGTGNFNQIFAGNKGGDIIDGGGGVDDRVWYREDPSGVVLNLSDKTVNPKAVTQLVKSIQKYAGADGFGSLLAMKDALEDLEMPSVTKVLSNRALDGWGDVDILSNIEAAQGSSFDDQLYGSNARNILSGGDGFDFIVGNGGDDHIIGGYGHDVLYGGLGLDWIVMDELKWGNLTPPQTGSYDRYNRDLDQNGNMVVYQSVSESTTSKADVLDGFVLGKDIIDLTNMDANTKRSGNQEFSDFIDINWPAPPKAGVLRISEFTGLTSSTTNPLVKPGQQDFQNPTSTYRLPYLLLEGDVNGDGVADFAIKLLGINVTSAQLTVNGLSDSILF